MAQSYPNNLGHSIRSASKELGIDDRTLRQAVKNGEVNVVDFGNVTRITYAELERLREIFKPVRSA
jgi:excisionase family DNA binding protein